MEIIFASMDSCPHCKTFAPKFAAAKAKYPNVKFTEAKMTQEFADKHTGGENRAPCLVRVDGKKKAVAFGDLAEPLFHKMIETGEVPALPKANDNQARLGWLYAKKGEIITRLEMNIPDGDTEEKSTKMLKAELYKVNIEIREIYAKRMSWVLGSAHDSSCSKKAFWKTDCKLCLRIRYGMIVALSLLALWWIYVI